jgi:hypothetical protein
MVPGWDLQCRRSPSISICRKNFGPGSDAAGSPGKETGEFSFLGSAEGREIRELGLCKESS